MNSPVMYELSRKGARCLWGVGFQKEKCFEAKMEKKQRPRSVTKLLLISDNQNVILQCVNMEMTITTLA